MCKNSRIMQEISVYDVVEERQRERILSIAIVDIMHIEEKETKLSVVSVNTCTSV